MIWCSPIPHIVGIDNALTSTIWGSITAVLKKDLPTIWGSMMAVLKRGFTNNMGKYNCCFKKRIYKQYGEV